MSVPPTTSNLDAASDPVCGTLVTIHSEFRAEYYGKDCYFCSEACVDLFVADPDAYESEGTVYMAGGGANFDNLGVRRITPPSGKTSEAAGAAPARPAAPVQPAIPPRAPAPPVADGTNPPESDLTIAMLPSRIAAAKAVKAAEGHRASSDSAVPPHPLADRVKARAESVGTGPVAWLQSFFVRHREAQAIRSASRAMLQTFLKVSAGRGPLERRDCYREMVMARLGNDTAGAERLLGQAGTSFANWPRPRALTLRDVVHFVAVLEYLADHPNCTGLQIDAGKLVADLVPADL